MTTDDVYNQDCVCVGTPVEPVDCDTSVWVIGACDGTTRTDTRTITVQPENGGKACPALTRERDCTPNIDCEVSAWTIGTCMEDDTRTDTRTITTQASGTGDACPDLTRVRDCVHTSPEYDLALIKTLKSGQPRIVES